MKNRPNCKARQYSDQMQCGDCGLVWDINDTDPPKCRKTTQREKAMAAIRQILERT